MISGVGDTGVGVMKGGERRRKRIVLYATQAASVANKATSGMTTASARVLLEIGVLGVVVVLESLEAERASKRLSGGVSASTEWTLTVWVDLSALWTDRSQKVSGMARRNGGEMAHNDG